MSLFREELGGNGGALRPCPSNLMKPLDSGACLPACVTPRRAINWTCSATYNSVVTESSVSRWNSGSNNNKRAVQCNAMQASEKIATSSRLSSIKLTKQQSRNINKVRGRQASTHLLIWPHIAGCTEPERPDLELLVCCWRWDWEAPVPLSCD